MSELWIANVSQCVALWRQIAHFRGSPSADRMPLFFSSYIANPECRDFNWEAMRQYPLVNLLTDRLRDALKRPGGGGAVLADWEDEVAG